IKGAERGVCTTDDHGSKAQKCCRPAAGSARSGRKHFPAGDLVARRQSQPGGKMLCTWPRGEVVAAFCDQLQQEVRTEAVDCGEVLSEQREQRLANVKS